jgi:beta-phosphoglucomutase-like phosphatase (HAD superfamily)
MKMIKTHAILWDNDGVFIDSESIFYEVIRLAFTGLGLNLTPEVWGT